MKKKNQYKKEDILHYKSNERCKISEKSKCKLVHKIHASH